MDTEVLFVTYFQGNFMHVIQEVWLAILCPMLPNKKCIATMILNSF
jgi:hypothetical protein